MSEQVITAPQTPQEVPGGASTSDVTNQPDAQTEAVSAAPQPVELEYSTLEAVPGGAVPPGLSFADGLRFLPIVMPILNGLLSGSATIPPFVVRTPLGRKRITVTIADA